MSMFLGPGRSFKYFDSTTGQILVNKHIPQYIYLVASSMSASQLEFFKRLFRPCLDLYDVEDLLVIICRMPKGSQGNTDGLLGLGL